MCKGLAVIAEKIGNEWKVYAKQYVSSHDKLLHTLRDDLRYGESPHLKFEVYFPNHVVDDISQDIKYPDSWINTKFGNKVACNEAFQAVYDYLFKNPDLLEFKVTMLHNANLAGMNLNKMDLSNARLDGANLSNSTLESADLGWARLDRANLSHSNLIGTKLNFANLSYSDLSNSVLERVKSKTSCFSYANLRKSNMVEAHFIDADFSYADFRGANLFGTKFKNSELGGAVFSPGALNNAILFDTELPDDYKE